MEITLETVRTVLRDAFGRDSFVASFITQVKADTTRQTAGIDTHGVMRYNPQFVDTFVNGPAELFCLIAHELMHPMFGHFVYHTGPLENVAGDLVINAALSVLFPRASAKGCLFRRLYKPIGLEGLLRPLSDMRQSRYAKLYEAFYESCVPDQKLSTGEVIQTLKVLTPANEVPYVMLLGAHERADDGEQGHTPGFTAQALGRMAQDFANSAQCPDSGRAGYGAGLYAFFLAVLKTHRSLKKALLQNFVTKQKLDRFKQVIRRPRIGVSPIPIQPSKRDFVLLAAGIAPFHYHNRVSAHKTEESGLAVYLDVSGSVNEYLPEIIGLLRSLKDDLTTVLLFSNAVVEVPFKTLLSGRVQTTGGTDFDCIARHIIEQGFDKAVIVTDGYACMTDENEEALQQRRIETLTVLFGCKTTCPEFEKFGPVMDLDEIAG